jgi:hypothetical protein
MPVDSICGAAPSHILALVRPTLRSILDDLKATTQPHLRLCITVEEFVRLARETQYSVVLLPADDLPSHHWCSLWGVVSLLNPRPSILVYTLQNDSKIWASVLAAGGYDVITAPFTHEKVGQLIESAEDCFHRRLSS